MPLLFRLPLGLIVAALGFMIVWKTEVVFGWVGPIDWAERKMGTRMFLKFLGVGVAFVGIFIATNIVSDILGGFASMFAPNR
ncbi:hypothetical protein A2856_00260 [Candidatus Uhrbacteria bacterium RIFCSPHIGHO2_01_FULL_63_20]|uniref:Uncharacterized protein n=1 Tax=Candidatus Uhrbacteria bacterium RIFCSPHIGHO2_01_FULL_63_20 TaxID=1802385 RepID=A0A1F7TLS0_9BACT|nr:MAG: hypothetical protein A2856_00260 [Candidatus Uhrbacteria bacterium RIFCSPHIGHO2_01_FULL_63_20]